VVFAESDESPGKVGVVPGESRKSVEPLVQPRKSIGFAAKIEDEQPQAIQKKKSIGFA